MRTQAIALILAAGIAGPACAQATTDEDRNMRDRVQPGERQVMPDRETDNRQHTKNRNFITYENFVDLEIDNNQGDEIGSIEDLVIDSKSGKIKDVVVLAGDFIGIGGKQITTQYDRLRIDPVSHEVVLNLTESEIEALPEFQEDRYSLDMHDSESEDVRARPNDREMQTPGKMLLVSDLMDREIVMGTTTVGVINAAFVDINSGRVMLLGFEPEGDLFDSDEDRLIPVGALTFGPQLSVKGNQQSLATAPAVPDDIELLNTRQDWDHLFKSFGLDANWGKDTDMQHRERDMNQRDLQDREPLRDTDRTRRDRTGG